MSDGRLADPARLSRWRRLLEVRQLQEQTRRAALAAEEQVAADLARRQASLEAARRAAEAATRERRRDGMRPQLEVWTARYLEQLVSTTADVECQQRVQEGRVERARGLALAARRARRGVETLVDRERTRLHEQKQKREQRGHDEVAQQRFLRAAAATEEETARAG